MINRTKELNYILEQLMINRVKLLDYIIDMTICNIAGMITILPYYAIIGMDVKNLWRVAVSFWTINWLTSFSVVWLLKNFRKKFPYKNKEL